MEECIKKEVLNDYESRLRYLEKSNSKSKEKFNSLLDKVSNTEKTLDAIHELTTSVAILADNMEDVKEEVRSVKKDVSQDIKDVKNDIDTIKQRPANNWNQIKIGVLISIISIVAGYLISLI